MNKKNNTKTVDLSTIPTTKKWTKLMKLLSEFGKVN